MPTVNGEKLQKKKKSGRKCSTRKIGRLILEELKCIRKEMKKDRKQIQQTLDLLVGSSRQNEATKEENTETDEVVDREEETMNGDELALVLYDNAKAGELSHHNGVDSDVTVQDASETMTTSDHPGPSSESSLKITELDATTPQNNRSIPLATKLRDKYGRFTCGVCGKSMTTFTNFKRHINVHFNIRPYQCDVCGKAFPCKSELTLHLRVHTGEKPFQCHCCQNCFIHKSSLNKHMKSKHLHRDVEKFSGKISKFSSKHQNVKSHISPSHVEFQPYQCSFCGKRFTRKFTLEGHIRIHTGDKPFACKICHKSFAVRSKLNRHLKVHMHEFVK